MTYSKYGLCRPDDRLRTTGRRPYPLWPRATGRRACPLAVCVVLLALAIAPLSGCGGQPQNAQGAAPVTGESPAIRIETLVLEPTLFEDVIQLTGSVEALEDARLSAQTAGTVVALAPLGRSLARHGIVAQIDPSLVNAAVSQAEAGLEAAKARFDLAEENLRRNEPLFQDSVISVIEWESVRSQYKQAEASLAQARALLSQARATLDQTRVTATFGGIVEAHYVELGEQVTPGMPVARLINTNRVKVVAGVPERYAADIRPGTPALVDLQAYRGRQLRSAVAFAGRAVDPQNRTFPIEIEIENPDGTIKPEMVARIEVTREVIEDALVVPRAAVIQAENGHMVYAVERSNGVPIARARSVELGPGFRNDVVVTNLSPGTEVIVLGQSNVTDGDRVEVMNPTGSSGMDPAYPPSTPTETTDAQRLPEPAD